MGIVFQGEIQGMTEQQVQARTRRKPRSLAQELVTVLTERIRSGQLKRGDKLPTESQIMVEEGVSRTVVREAISRLQAAGQVETRHGIGTFVIERAPEPYIGVQITKAGRERFHLGGEDISLGAGDLVIWTSTQAAEFTVMERLHKVSLVLPWSDIQERLPRGTRFNGTVIDSRVGIGAVLYSHVDSLARQLDQVGELLQARLQRVQARDPFHHFLQGAQHEREGNFALAIRDYRQAIKLFPVIAALNEADPLFALPFAQAQRLADTADGATVMIGGFGTAGIPDELIDAATVDGLNQFQAFVWVKLPLIWPRPPMIGSLMTGAEITLSSSTIAKGRPTLSRVMEAKRSAPTPSKRKETTGWPPWGSNCTRASVSLSPARRTVD